MIRQFARNGYTVYKATERDEKKYAGVYADNFYIYFSSDIRDFGIGNSYFEFECESIDIANEIIDSCGNYARAKELCEESITCVSADDIERMEKILDKAEDDDTALEIFENGDSVNMILLDIPFKASTISAEDNFQACIFDFLSTYNGESGYKVIESGISADSDEYYHAIGKFALSHFTDTSIHALIIEDAITENVTDMYYFNIGGTLAHRIQSGEVVERERVASFISLERAEDYAKSMNNRTTEDNIFYEIEVDA